MAKKIPSYEEMFECNSPMDLNTQWGSDYFDAKNKKRLGVPVYVEKKRGRMSRGDELVDDPVAKSVASNILDDIKTQPGIISLDSRRPETKNLVPVPQVFNKASKTSIWSPNQLKEGQLLTLLKLPADKFSPLPISPIRGGKVEPFVLSSSESKEESMKKLHESNNSSNGYVRFASAIASILRRCESETANSITRSIVSILENELDVQK